MMRRLIFASATISTLAISFCPTDAVADSIPHWDVTPSCRGAASAGFSQQTTESVKRCLEDEQHTREELNKAWSTFSAADRINCVRSLTFEPTYTELATCLEMSRDMKNLPGAKPADAAPRR